MRALSLMALAGFVFLINTCAADTNHLDQAATSAALDTAVRSRQFLSFEDEMNKAWDKVESIRWRYKEFLRLQKEGYASYRAATDMFVMACKRAIEHHYHLKKHRPEFDDAVRKANEFRASKDNVRNGINFQNLVATKTAAESYFREEKRLRDEAMKAWTEGLKQKQITDSKSRPASPPPKPKSKDPYLEEQP